MFRIAFTSRSAMNSLPFALSLALRRAFCQVLSSTLPSRVTSVVVAGLLFSVAMLHAQSSRVGLISQAVNEANRVTLPGNVHPLATRTADRGAVPDSTPANRMLLLLQRSPQQESQLRVYLESLQDANSPNFHRWLTPQQFGAQWGAADSDVAAVTAWLQS